ncbi:mechanosensitive ion channel [Puniceicoccales bacterium CK1056]|uniref:Mechanosensitive ion channel n=1 Tax=Oceanipulchritudo coccoides TaxID=2706888 RepID=A0A6B2M1T1_9BACT|nr:mechanosensitive ion channel domain-containing protein [Oceanipulchritudo coccoides]NDV61690.1 mechanosensitive ion channel [Oceanipulchritudo coccoides]
MEGFWTGAIEVGSVSFTPVSVIFGTVLLIVALILQRVLYGILTRRFFPRFKIHPGLGNAYATLIGYTFLTLCFFLILPVTFNGLNWATLSVILGAISFGVGFGLRNIADNFVSGLIILLERPVRVGDRVTIDDVSGVVTSIRARSATIRTNDNIEVIVPNSRFISASVINWSHSDNRVRFRVPVGVHYNSDVFHVKEVLEKAVTDHPHVLSDPAPSAKFVEFGDSSLNFEVWVWTVEWTLRPSAFKSEINYIVWKALKDANIEIPYPQRDIYIKEIKSGSDILSPGDGKIDL